MKGDLVEYNLAVIIPCYKVKDKILAVIANIGENVRKIYVVDDACPDHSGDYVRGQCQDERICVIKLRENVGVGGAVMTGYRQALDEGMDILVKLDGDGQMDPQLIPNLIQPLLDGHADYTKGNRFFNLESLHVMPKFRLFGNAVLSFMAKLSSGYWDIFDPTNGYTAMHRSVAERLPFDKVSRRYFFETDILFRLNTLRAVVIDIPMDARYGNEKSNLNISEIIGEFLWKHLRNFAKRIFYNYYLRDMSLASIELPLGLLLLSGGVSFGLYHWINAWQSGTMTNAGTVMLAALPILMGMQFILAFLSYDIANVPRKALQKRIGA